MNQTLQEFFYHSFESAVNEQMMDRSFVLPRQQVLDYLRRLLQIPCSDFVRFVLEEMARFGISTMDIPQFSSWEDGTESVCREIAKAGDSGFKHTEIGVLLMQDGKERNKIAYRKYGEGHAKLGRMLGLLQSIDKTYYLSCLGATWAEVPQEMKEPLYTRFLLRTGLIKFLLHATRDGEVDFKRVARSIGLSDVGCYRRHSNVMFVLDKLCATDEYDFSEFRKKVNIDTLLVRERQ